MGTKPEELFQSVNPEESPINSDGFVGVDPIYQNFANEVDNPEPKPEPESEPEAKTEDAGDGDKAAPEAKTESTPKAPATTKKS